MTNQQRLTEYVDKSLSSSVTAGQRQSVHTAAQEALADDCSYDTTVNLCKKNKGKKFIDEDVLRETGYVLAQQFKVMLDNESAEQALNAQAELRNRCKNILCRALNNGGQEEATLEEWEAAVKFAEACVKFEKFIVNGGTITIVNHVRNKAIQYGVSHLVFDRANAAVLLRQPKYMGGTVQLSVNDVLNYGK